MQQIKNTCLAILGNTSKRENKVVKKALLIIMIVSLLIIPVIACTAKSTTTASHVSPSASTETSIPTSPSSPDFTFVWELLPLNGGVIWSLAFDPSNPQIIYAGTEGGGVWKSSDGGASWGASSSGLTISDVRCVAINPSNPQILYAGTYGGGVFKSSDGGASWISSSSGLANSYVQCLAIDYSTPKAIYAGTESGVCKSSDGGANWASSGMAGSLILCLSINPSNSQTLFAGVYLGGVWKSSDGGASWGNASSGLTNSVGVYSLAISPSNPQILYAGTGWDGVFKSSDGGASWAASSSGLTNSAAWCLAINPSNPQILYVGTYGGGVFKSSDGGASWGASSNGLTSSEIRCLAIDASGNIYAGSFNKRLFRLATPPPTQAATITPPQAATTPPPQSNLESPISPSSSQPTSEETTSTPTLVKWNGTQMYEIWYVENDLSIPVDQRKIHLRNGPGTEYSQIVDIPALAEVDLFGTQKNAKGDEIWAFVRYQGNSGWVYYAFLTANNPASTPSSPSPTELTPTPKPSSAPSTAAAVYDSQNLLEISSFSHEFINAGRYYGCAGNLTLQNKSSEPMTVTSIYVVWGNYSGIYVAALKTLELLIAPGKDAMVAVQSNCDLVAEEAINIWARSTGSIYIDYELKSGQSLKHSWSINSAPEVPDPALQQKLLEAINNGLNDY